MILPGELLVSVQDDLVLNGYPPVQDAARFISLLNEGAMDLALQTNCIEREAVLAVNEYLKEGNYTTDASTDSTTIYDTELDSTTDDYYNGWRVYNITRGMWSYVLDYVGLGQKITLASAITGQIAGDTYYIINKSDEITLPEDYIIEYFARWGDNSELVRMNRKDALRNQISLTQVTGTPRNFIPGIRKYKLFPQPNEDNMVYLWYYARPKLISADVTAYASSAGGHVYLSKDYIKSYPSSRIVGSRIVMMEGSYEGENVEIMSATTNTNGLLCSVYPSFTGNVAADTLFNMYDPNLDDDYFRGLKYFVLRELYMAKKGYEIYAQKNAVRWEEHLQRVKDQSFKRRTPPVIRLRGTGGYGPTGWSGTITP